MPRFGGLAGTRAFGRGRVFTVKPTVTGGVLSSDSTYFYRTFTGNGTLGITGSPLAVDFLAVAGGGAPGGNGGGGGGAGGLRSGNNIELFGNNSMVIGAGAVGNGGVASSTVFTSYSEVRAGGWGRSRDNAPVSTQTLVGSGGGGCGYQSSNPSGANQGIGTTGEGNNGGPGTDYGLGADAAGGGGGGAGAIGGSGSFRQGGRGGDGSSAFSSWGLATGTGQNIGGTYWYAGGGGGGVTVSGTGGAGGNGGGGTGESTNGTANTGGGAGGDTSAGGSGIIIVRYLKSAVA